jgi:hypothetical protein
MKPLERTPFNKRKQGLLKNAYELVVLTCCRASLSIERKHAAQYDFDPAERQPSKHTNRAIKSRKKSREAILAVEQALPTTLTLPEASPSSIVALDPSRAASLAHSTCNHSRHCREISTTVWTGCPLLASRAC